MKVIFLDVSSGDDPSDKRQFSTVALECRGGAQAAHSEYSLRQSASYYSWDMHLSHFSHTLGAHRTTLIWTSLLKCWFWFLWFGWSSSKFSAMLVLLILRTFTNEDQQGYGWQTPPIPQHAYLLLLTLNPCERCWSLCLPFPFHPFLAFLLHRTYLLI